MESSDNSINMVSRQEDTSTDSVKPALVFLVGPPRSGTTWLQKLLGNHPAVGTAQESHLFNHYFGELLIAWDRLLEFNDGRGGIGLAAFQTEDQFLAMLRNNVYEILGNADEYHKGQVFLEKTPDHIRHINDIQRVLPDAKIILMTRKPADVIESMLNASQSWGKHWAPTSIVSAIRLFRFFKFKGEKDLQQADTGGICVVEYEKLKDNPQQILTELLDFLQLDNQPETVESMLSSEFTLRKYGEFALQSGNSVVEPSDFSRKKKGKLSWFQRILVHFTLGHKALDIESLPLTHVRGR